MEMLKDVAGVNVVHVPYKGASQFMPDLLSGEVQLAYVGIAQAIPLVNSGKLKAIAIGSAQRLDALSGVPTIAETYPGFEANGDWNYYAPAGTPSDIVMKLNAAINNILVMPDVRELLISQGGCIQSVALPSNFPCVRSQTMISGAPSSAVSA